MRVTPNFDSSEFDCHDGTDYPEELIATRLMPLCIVLERVRAVFGAPIFIVSGYRSPAHNAKIGGAKESRHVQGDAADLRVRGYSPQEVHDAVLRLFKARKIEVGGLGLYKNWIHLDVRPLPKNRHLAQWTGVGVGSEPA